MYEVRCTIEKFARLRHGGAGVLGGAYERFRNFLYPLRLIQMRLPWRLSQ